MRLDEVPTPAFVLGLAKFERNCARMIERCRSLGVPLRPHMKTLKSVEAARIATDPSHGGIAVSTLAEAEYFAGFGIADIQYAVCITPDKLPRAAAIMGSAPLFSFFLESIDTARAVAAFADANQLPLRAWIEIDSGEHRTGLGPADPRIVEIAAILRGSASLLAGVATHGGHSYLARGAEALRTVAEQERLAVVSAAELLRDCGYEVPGVSAGSTPTSTHACSGEGLSEFRAGVYMVGDLFQAALGAQSEQDVAGSVLATVISHKPEHNQIVLDAGGLALSKDRSTAALPDADAGYGLVVDMGGEASFGRLIVEGVHQEHGEVRSASPIPFDRLPIGSRVRILPNHVCMTAAAHARYVVVEKDEVQGVWEKTGGW
jgi:D-serine deaminase-like pyridoxal phosphate-dependent protein